MRSLLRALPLFAAVSPWWYALEGCDPAPLALDAAVVAAEDASSRDVGADARRDGGCTGLPGELAGPRSVESGQFPLLAWPTVGGEIALLDHHEPCAPAGGVLVLRQLADWSAHARWHVAHTAPLVAMDDVFVLDLWSADEDALPARATQLGSFASRYDAAPDALALDPEETLAPLALGGIALPLVAILDVRTLHLERVLFDPRAGEVERAVRTVQARLREEPPPELVDPVLVDGRFTADRWDLVQGMAAPFVPPPSPTNAVADDPRAATLGQHVFEDAMFSPRGVACRTCHQARLAFTDGRPRGVGASEVDRNTPTVLGSAGVRWQFWDGRADTLWAQALGPIENAREMQSSRLYVARWLWQAYRAEYEAIFGALPPLDDAARFPPNGMPGDPAWEAMAEADREAVTRLFVNVGKAIEAYERTLVPTAGRLEAYAAGSFEALSAAERDGLRAYFEAGCAQCHAGPLLENGAFHALDMPGVGEGALGDQGRLAAFAQLGASPFRAQGAYSDDRSIVDPLAGLTTLPETTRGAFRTPTLRAISETAPYGHAGTFGTLREVVLHYARIRMPRPPDPRVVGELEVHLRGFEDRLVDPIVTFLEVL